MVWVLFVRVEGEVLLGVVLGFVVCVWGCCWVCGYYEYCVEVYYGELVVEDYYWGVWGCCVFDGFGGDCFVMVDDEWKWRMCGDCGSWLFGSDRSCCVYVECFVCFLY